MSQPSNEDKSSSEMKHEGNESLKSGKFDLAILQYTTAIKKDPKDHTLYSNRSVAFLKIDQCGLALEDAMEVIKLKPDWAKGYFRKGQVEFQLKQFDKAIESYKKCLSLDPTNQFVTELISKATLMKSHELTADHQIPWLGAGLGIIAGILIVIVGYCFGDLPSLHNPLIMVFVTILVSAIGFIFGKIYRMSARAQQEYQAFNRENSSRLFNKDD